MKMNLKDRVEQSFGTYAAMAIQHRAIFDVRDCLKPSQRMGMYSQVLDKITYKHAHKKTHLSIVSAMKHFYVHGDAAMAGVLCRMGSPISMRYPIEDTIGNMGTYAHLDDFAAPRYTEMRLSKMGTKMVEGIDKESIDMWFDNFDNTEQFPAVLPSLGYYNIVNGTTGIAVGMASSIPQFNLREVNEAMIKLLWNPDIDFDEIYCAPDFATGGTILNADEVKESLRVGRGKSAIIRGSIEYDEKENALQVTEVPYGVATNRIFNELGGLFNPDPNSKSLKKIPATACAGIKRFTDSSEEIVDITVWLEKGAIPANVMRNLYKYTAIQSYFPINMTMLDNGTRPKVFGWKEALQAHLDHEIVVRTKMHEYDIRKIDERLPIVEAICLALANVDEVVAIIRGASNTADAKTKLIARFSYTDAQAKAVVDIKLGRLATLEIQSFEDEKEQLRKDREYHVLALNDKDTLYKEIENDLREVANAYGDERRTRLMNLDYKGEGDETEVIEKKELLLHFTNLGNIYTQTSSTLTTTHRGGKGSKVKMQDNEVITKTIADDNLGYLLLFSNKGKVYRSAIADLLVDAKINTVQMFEFEPGERITTITTISRREATDFIVFVTKNGMVKKTAFDEYNFKKGKSLKAINLKDDDEVIAVHPVNREPIGILTFNGNFVIINTEKINAIGRVAAGVCGIKLNEGDRVIDSKVISGKYLMTATANGLVKKAELSELPECTRGTKGKKISGVRKDDRVVKFLTLSQDCDIIVISTRGLIKIKSDEIKVASRDATGVTGMKIPEGAKVVDLAKA